MKYKLIVLIFMVLPAHVMADFYQWKDDDGVLQFSDKRPETTHKVTRIKKSEPPTVPSALLYSKTLTKKEKKPAVVKHHKRQVAIIKDKHQKKVTDDHSIDPDFKRVTGFNNANQLDVARDNCKRERYSDCSTSALISMERQRNRDYIEAQSHSIDRQHVTQQQAETH